MSARTRLLVPLAALTILAAGCATTDASSRPAPATSPRTSASAGSSMSGMSMPDMATGAGPSATARMVCGAEIRGNVARVSALSAPAGTSTWADHLYTCTYRLPAGSLVLSVKDSADAASGKQFFARLRQHVGHTTPLSGMLSLGLPSFQTSDGTVVFLKDGKTLTVDATRLPSTIGRYRQSRPDLAYAVAASVVACWSE